MRIEKKAWPEYFQKIADGVKTADLRLADFDCNPGDVLVLREWDPKTRNYTGRVLEKTVTYVMRTKGQKLFKQEDVERQGWQVICFK